MLKEPNTLILPLARRLAGKEASVDIGHKLMPLWSELRRHLEQLDPREDDKDLPAIEDFIRTRGNWGQTTVFGIFQKHEIVVCPQFLPLSLSAQRGKRPDWARKGRPRIDFGDHRHAMGKSI